jgi:hypothetical protein
MRSFIINSAHCHKKHKQTGLQPVWSRIWISIPCQFHTVYLNFEYYTQLVGPFRSLENINRYDQLRYLLNYQYSNATSKRFLSDCKHNFHCCMSFRHLGYLVISSSKNSWPHFFEHDEWKMCKLFFCCLALSKKPFILTKALYPIFIRFTSYTLTYWPRNKC